MLTISHFFIGLLFVIMCRRGIREMDGFDAILVFFGLVFGWPIVLGYAIINFIFTGDLLQMLKDS